MSHEEAVDAKGQTSSCDVTIQFVDRDSWTWKGTNFLEGSQQLPNLDFTFTRATSGAAANYQEWIKYLAGTWTVTGGDSETYDEFVESASGGKALLSRGKFADGVQYTRQVGWEADTGTLVETWCLANGTYLVNRYQEIDERKCVGQTKIVDVDGHTAHGTIIRERINDDELKSLYHGGLPGQTEKVEMTWISKRR